MARAAGQVLKAAQSRLQGSSTAKLQLNPPAFQNSAGRLRKTNSSVTRGSI